MIRDVEVCFAAKKLALNEAKIVLNQFELEQNEHVKFLESDFRAQTFLSTSYS